ncbi:MAG: hypothetical protein M3417_15820 [Actinomycetota bacterium]|nr:hypothetical protein [Actinomycetota bacterium]
MTATSPIAPTALISNGRPANTAVSLATTSMRHGLESDPELYAKVMSRLPTPGESISLDDVLQRLDAGAVH